MNEVLAIVTKETFLGMFISLFLALIFTFIVIMKNKKGTKR